MDIEVKKAWSMGFSLILLFIVLGEIVVAFNDYFFHRLNINRDLLLGVLWSLPFLAAFTTSFYLRKFNLWLIATYIVALPLLAALAHYLHGYAGGVVDFSGAPGAFAVFKIYFFIGSVLLLSGSGVGILASQVKVNGKR